jgi:pentatricopeptide repeat protein
MHTYRAECFGQFMLTDGEVTLTQEEMRSDRLLNLLSFLIVNRKRNPSIEEIGNAVCGEDSEQSGASVIKNLVWRMRKLLKSKWPDEQFILTFRGGYKLNPELKVTTDYEEMEDLIQRAGQSEVVEEKAALLNQAFETYKGRFLVGCETERWAANLAVYYQNGAIAVAKRLAALYESLGAYEEVERVVHRATAEDALDEALWTILIRSYGEAGKMQKAEETFHQVSDSLYNALGIGPSPELSSAYKSALKQMQRRRPPALKR